MPTRPQYTSKRDLQDAPPSRRQRGRIPLAFTLEAHVVAPPNLAEYLRLWDRLLREETTGAGSNQSSAGG